MSVVKLPHPLPSAPLNAGSRARALLPTTGQLLAQGGDARILLAPDHLVNNYGCPAHPDPDLLAFGSATASVISAPAFAAAEELRRRLIHCADAEAQSLSYAHELERVRHELLALCGVADQTETEVVFAASGTDLHLIAAQLVGQRAALPTRVIMVDHCETGSGVASALAGRHFSNCTAVGDAVTEGIAVPHSAALEVETIAIRAADGSARPCDAIDAAAETRVTAAVARRQRVLLILVDVSKTGLIAPSPACVARLAQDFPDSIDVLVDACQYRIAPATLQAYLARGFMLALTGSKFITGPSFAGALLLPALLARRLRRTPVPRSLRNYSVQGDWPAGWPIEGRLEKHANLGLLLRWQAALHELRAFRAIPEAKISGFLLAFADAVQQRLAHDPCFAPLPAPMLDRSPLIAAASWDHIPTIFPFFLRRPSGSNAKIFLNSATTGAIHRLLALDLRDHPDHRSAANHSAALRCQLGQPVIVGSHAGQPASALRLCASARLVVAATTRNGSDTADIIARALAVLDKTAWLVRTTRSL